MIYIEVCKIQAKREVAYIYELAVMRARAMSSRIDFIFTY